LRDIIVHVGKWAVAWFEGIFQYSEPGNEKVLSDNFKARKE